MRIWGITGTNGKTTTTWILADFLHAAYITTVEVNTLKRTFHSGYTTPPADALASIYAEMREAGAKDCVMEVSSHAIVQDRVGFGKLTKFSGGAFLNLTEDHLDYHKTMEEYFRAKFLFAKRLAEQAAAENRKLPFVVCMDGEGAERMLHEAMNLEMLDVIPVTIAEPHFDLSQLALHGDFNKSNVLVAATLAEAAGVPHDAIQERIPQLRPRWGRFEKIACPHAYADVYVDFAHTPDAISKVLQAARQILPPFARLWIVFGAGGDRDAAKRPLMGAAAAHGADRVVVTSDNPRSENPLDIISEIEKGVTRVRPDASGFIAIPDRREAIGYALANAARGDIVLVCGKGHETTQEIAGVQYPFDDRAVAATWARDDFRLQLSAVDASSPGGAPVPREPADIAAQAAADLGELRLRRPHPPGCYVWRIRTNECGPDGFAKLPAILNLFQEAASLNAQELGFSRSNFMNQGENISWVLTRLKVKIERQPRWGDGISILTWPTTARKIAARRDFIILDSSTRKIGAATSEWMLIDLAARKIVSLPDSVGSLSDPAREPALKDDAFSQLRWTCTEPVDALEFHARRSDIDLNGHVNNVRYVEWMLECVPPERGFCKELELVFKSETFAGDRVLAEAVEVSDGVFMHKLSAPDGHVHVLAKSVWAQKE